MSTQREEVALRRSLEERRPLAIPPELSARLDRIPLEVKQRPSAPKRAVLAVVPWAGLVAAGLILAFGPLVVTGPAADPGTAPRQPWDPVAAAPAYNDIGIFGLPWVPALVFLGLAGLAWTAWRLATRRPLRPAVRASIAALREHGRGPAEAWALVIAIGAPALVLGALRLASMEEEARGPLEVIRYAPGQGVSEVRQDGGLFGADWEDSGAPDKLRYVYRMQPQERFTYLFTIRNAGPVPTRLLGVGGSDGTLSARAMASRPWILAAIGLPRDPAHPTGRLDDTVPFHPVDIPAFGEITLVAGYVAGDCADPTAALQPRKDNNFGFSPEYTYETLGWRQTVRLYAEVDVTVTTAPGSSCTDRPS